MADLATMGAQLEGLRAIRAKGALKLRMGDEEVTYRSDAELVAAIEDLQRRIAAATTPRVSTVRFTTSKGL